MDICWREVLLCRDGSLDVTKRPEGLAKLLAEGTVHRDKWFCQVTDVVELTELVTDTGEQLLDGLTNVLLAVRCDPDNRDVVFCGELLHGEQQLPEVPGGSGSHGFGGESLSGQQVTDEPHSFVTLDGLTSIESDHQGAVRLDRRNHTRIAKLFTRNERPIKRVKVDDRPLSNGEPELLNQALVDLPRRQLLTVPKLPNLGHHVKPEALIGSGKGPLAGRVYYPIDEGTRAIVAVRGLSCDVIGPVQTHKASAGCAVAVSEFLTARCASSIVESEVTVNLGEARRRRRQRTEWKAHTGKDTLPSPTATSLMRPIQDAM